MHLFWARFKTWAQIVAYLSHSITICFHIRFDSIHCDKEASTSLFPFYWVVRLFWCLINHNYSISFSYPKKIIAPTNQHFWENWVGSWVVRKLTRSCTSHRAAVTIQTLYLYTSFECWESSYVKLMTTSRHPIFGPQFWPRKKVQLVRS